MLKRSLLILVLTIASGGTLLRAQSADLPPGPVQAKARTACLECHEARVIVQQRLSKPVWTKEVDKMIKWGAVVEASDRDAFIEYLSTNFGTDKPAYVADKTETQTGHKETSSRLP